MERRSTPPGVALCVPIPGRTRPGDARVGRVSVLEQRMRKWAVSTCLVGIVLLLAAGCGAEKDALERMVPAGSSLIAEVDLARVLEDEDLASSLRSACQG